MFIPFSIGWVVDNQRQIVSLTSQGKMYAMEKKYSVALKFYQEAWDISRKIRDSVAEANTIFLIGEVYTFINQNKKALSFYVKAINTRHVDVSGKYIQLRKLVFRTI